MTELLPESFHIKTQEVGTGSGRVVFFHGLMGRGKNFMTAAKGLAETHTSLLVDLPNHGESGWTERFDYAEQADLLAAVLAGGYAKDVPVNLVGHSMGAKMAMVLATRHPELFERVVIVDMGPGATPGPDRGQNTDFTHLLGSLKALDLSTINSRGEAGEALAEHIPSRTVRGFLLQNLKRGRDGFEWEPNLDLLYASLDVIGGEPDYGEGHFDGPVLWMGGAKSNYVSTDQLPLMKRLFPRTNRITIKDAGHWVHSEQPASFLHVLKTFLGQTFAG
ncbi:alpha/beta fold hydrolase [Gulosibacter molinativorax]|uniref:Alpha/beta hydrolase n=1 Tax=Gulosibacter molinativorax TaxID=256821 RepID=A0ABT7C5Q9_9MICO|nr:alpha/beta fold hydrolase [Gulosibacter molinativorax]MDJ1370536.1 alpha/beta hydrolase [Gulosibacter molinativorax]QUY62051.1 Esterase YbfF [Gulosibacter molinativorax]